MILYYALGGGLGHVARSFALIHHAPEPLRSRIRLLVSTKSALVALPHSPCPMDTVPEEAMADRKAYGRFLDDYFGRHDFSSMVIDTFPFGLLGELKLPAPDLPRVLIGRYLRWDAYCERCGGMEGAVWPRAAVMIEDQEEAYLEAIERNSRVINAPWPVSLASGAGAIPPADKPAFCVAHSGPAEETRLLVEKAKAIMAGRGIEGLPEVFIPERGLFPLEHHLSHFSDVVAGAGYAACAAAAVLKGLRRYHLHPFPRRFDDQALRLRRLLGGDGQDHPAAGTATVAGILWEETVLTV